MGGWGAFWVSAPLGVGSVRGGGGGDAFFVQSFASQGGGHFLHFFDGMSCFACQKPICHKGE